MTDKGAGSDKERLGLIEDASSSDYVWMLRKLRRIFARNVPDWVGL